MASIERVTRRFAMSSSAIATHSSCVATSVGE
jgi:hypothetical protein